MREIGTSWDRDNRNIMNENFAEADRKVLEQKQRVDRLIQDAPQPSEVVDARGEHAVLGDRLNDFTAKLAQTTEHINSKEINVLYPPVPMVGAKGDGVTDDTLSLQNIAEYTNSLGVHAKLLIPESNYKTTGKLMIKCQLEAGQATIDYYGTGTALVIGDDTAPNIVTARKKFELPRVINMLRGTDGWDGTSEGVKCVNLNTCEIHVPFIQDFEKGLIAFGNGGGNAYNNYHLGALWENHKNLVLDTDETGYTNQNLFIGGRLQHSTLKGATLDDPEACQIYMATPYGGGPNNNTFINTSFEGENVAFYRVDMSGKYNQFINCRWEFVGNPPRVRYRETAQWNKILGGYAAQDLVEVFDGNLGGGEINDNIGAYIRSQMSAEQLIPNNIWTTLNKWTVGTHRRATHEPAIGKWTPRPGRWLINVSVMFRGNITGTRQIRILCNGSEREITSIFPNTTNQATVKATTIYNFNGKESFEIQVKQASGGELGITPGIFTKIEAEYLGY